MQQHIYLKMDIDKLPIVPPGDMLEVGRWNSWYPKYQLRLMRMEGMYEYIESSKMPDFLSLPVFDSPAGKDDEGNTMYETNPKYAGRGDKDMFMMDYR